MLAVVTTEATKQKKKFFVVKKRGINKQWLPITLYDDEGHYRGVAYFDDFFTAFKYMQKFEQKLIKNYLREVNDNNGGNWRHNTKHEREFKVFCEDTIPNIKAGFYK